MGEELLLEDSVVLYEMVEANPIEVYQPMTFAEIDSTILSFQLPTDTTEYYTEERFQGELRVLQPKDTFYYPMQLLVIFVFFALYFFKGKGALSFKSFDINKRANRDDNFDYDMDNRSSILLFTTLLLLSIPLSIHLYYLFNPTPIEYDLIYLLLIQLISILGIMGVYILRNIINWYLKTIFELDREYVNYKSNILSIIDISSIPYFAVITVTLLGTFPTEWIYYSTLSLLIINKFIEFYYQVTIFWKGYTSIIHNILYLCTAEILVVGLLYIAMRNLVFYVV